MTTQAKSLLFIRVGDAVQRVLDRDAEPGLDQRPVELAGDRLLALPDDGVDRLRHRVAGRQAAGDELQRVRQLREEGGRSA